LELFYFYQIEQLFGIVQNYFLLYSVNIYSSRFRRRNILKMFYKIGAKKSPKGSNTFWFSANNSQISNSWATTEFWATFYADETLNSNPLLPWKQGRGGTPLPTAALQKKKTYNINLQMKRLTYACGNFFFIPFIFGTYLGRLSTFSSILKS